MIVFHEVCSSCSDDLAAVAYWNAAGDASFWFYCCFASFHSNLSLWKHCLLEYLVSQTHVEAEYPTVLVVEIYSVGDEVLEVNTPHIVDAVGSNVAFHMEFAACCMVLA